MHDPIFGRAGRLYQKSLGQGPDLVLLHGWGFNSEIWNEVQVALADRYRVTALDLPGHGLSAGRRLGQLADAADLLCEELPGPAIWIGWSLGGLLALEASRRAPGSIRRVIAVAGTPRFVKGEDWPHAVAPEVLDEFARGLERDYRKTLTRFLALQVRGDAAGKTDLRRLREVLFARPPSPAGLRDGLSILRSADLRRGLSAPACPVRFILGERDALVPVEVVEDLGAGHARVVAGAGHVPFLSHRADFLRALREVLSV